ncbi:MAG: ferritin [Candidatus Hydrogenedentota bacterium]
MLSKVIEDKLNEQLGHELYSAYLYYSMSAYFESVNLDGFANWMKIQAQEELTHVDKIFGYVNNRGGRVRLTAVAAPTVEWASPVAAMQDSYKHECFISGTINACVSLALSTSDHSTNAFLQWFVAEQVEEEKAADEVLQKLKLIGDNGSGMFLLDNELSKRTLAGPSAGGQAN